MLSVNYVIIDDNHVMFLWVVWDWALTDEEKRIDIVCEALKYSASSSSGKKGMDDGHGSVWQELLHATEKLAANDHRIAAIEERLRYIQEHLLSARNEGLARPSSSTPPTATTANKLEDSVSPGMADMPDRNDSLLIPVISVDPSSLVFDFGKIYRGVIYQKDDTNRYVDIMYFGL